MRLTNRRRSESIGTAPLLSLLAGWLLCGTWSAEAYACSPPSSTPVYPVADATDVPTNAKLMFVSGFGASPWIREVRPALPDAAPETGSLLIPDSGVADGGEPGAVHLEVACLEERIGSLCFATATLEPNTSYVWGATDEEGYAEVFTTGDSPRTPQPLPDVTVDFGGFEDGGGGGSCATRFFANLTAKFAASPEPWVLWPTNPSDSPMFVSSGSTELAWASIDPTDCFVMRQVNWLGQVSTTDVEVCVPDPNSDRDAGETPELDSAVAKADAQAPVSTATPNTSNVDGLDAGHSTNPHTSLDASTTPVRDAGSEGSGQGANEEGGCGCRAASSKPGTLAWVAPPMLGLVWRRRRSARR